MPGNFYRRRHGHYDENPVYEQRRQAVLTVQPEDLGPFAVQMRRLRPNWWSASGKG
jgi:hypothetical protein